MGEAAKVTATIGYEALEHCTGDDLEVLTAFCGLDGDSSPGGAAVIAALKARPEALASLCSFMAFTPCLAAGSAKGFDSYDVDFKGANSTSKLLPLTPAQSSEAHFLVMASCVRLFLLCATSELAPVLCSVDHFEHSVLRLVELVGRHRPPMREADMRDISLATFATKALCAIGSADSRACAFINGATHPFGGSKATDLMFAVNGASSQFRSQPEDCLPLHVTIPMAAVFLSIFSRCLTGSWFSPAATLWFLAPWFVLFVVLPSGFWQTLMLSVANFWSLPSTTSIFLRVPLAILFSVISVPCVRKKADWALRWICPLGFVFELIDDLVVMPVLGRLVIPVLELMLALIKKCRSSVPLV